MPNNKDSIRKCADAAVFLGKINQDILNLRREKIAPELNQNYKQLTFKTEDHPKLLFGDDLPKTIKDIRERKQVGQSLTQRYQPALKRETFTKTRKPFLSKDRGYQQRGKPGRMFNHIHFNCNISIFTCNIVVNIYNFSGQHKT